MSITPISCKIADCKNIARTVKSALCDKHYQRLKFHNDVNHATPYDKRSAIVDGDTASIPLGVKAKNGYAIVDADMAWLADEYKWNISSSGYAITAATNKLRMHHLVIGKPIDYMVTDHINRDRLDNRRVNLRHISFADNIRNSRGQSGTESGYKGVARSGNRWRAYYNPDGRQVNIGSYVTKEEAARAYDEKAFQAWGEFAYLNFPK